MNKILLLLLSALLFSPMDLLKSEDRQPLWESNRFEILSVYNQTMLVGYTNGFGSSYKYEKIDLVNKATGLSLWDNKQKDIRSFMTNKSNIFDICSYNNLLIISNSDPHEQKIETICFDVLTGSMLWKNNDLCILADSFSFFEKKSKVICIKENIVYATYLKKNKSQMVKLLEFDMLKGEIVSSNDIKLHYDLDDDTLNRNPIFYIPIITTYNNNFLFIQYSNLLQCYDLKNKKLIWKTLKFINTAYLDRNNVVLSVLEDYECGMTCTYRFLNINTGKQVFEITGYENAKLINDFLYIQQTPCSHNIDSIKKDYLTKFDTGNARILKEIPMETRLCSFSKNYLITSCLTKNKTKGNTNELKIIFYDHDLNIIDTITKITDAQYWYIDAIDDVCAITYTSKEKNISKTELYALPDFEKNRNISFARFIKWLIQYLLNKITHP